MPQTPEFLIPTDHLSSTPSLQFHHTLVLLKTNLLGTQSTLPAFLPRPQTSASFACSINSYTGTVVFSNPYSGATHGSQTPALLEGSGGKGLSAEGRGGFSFGGVAGMVPLPITWEQGWLS